MKTMKDVLIQSKIISGNTIDELNQKLGKYLLNGYTLVGTIFNTSEKSKTYSLEERTSRNTSGYSGLFSSYSSKSENVSIAVLPKETNNFRYSQMVSNNGTPLKQSDKLEWQIDKNPENDHFTFKATCRGTKIYEACIENLYNYKWNDLVMRPYQYYKVTREGNDYFGNISIHLNEIRDLILKNVYTKTHVKIFENNKKPLLVNSLFDKDFQHSYALFGKELYETLEQEIVSCAEKDFENLKNVD